MWTWSSSRPTPTSAACKPWSTANKLLLTYGAQDLSPHQSGAYTGDISGPMLAKLGCSYVVVGHSERRQYHTESDELVNSKVKAALADEITPILCIGEGLEIREAGNHVEHTLSQLDGGLAGLTGTQVEKVVIAYEPVWAIGTGRRRPRPTPRRSSGRFVPG